MIDIRYLEDYVFPFVEKPARYIGGEIHSIQKSHEGRTTLALVYPDIYEIGISNLGLRILYDIVNRDDRFVCERAYAPWVDMEERLREHSLPLYGLESKTSLRNFDVVGFSFQYELLYTNFLTILDLSGIAFFSRERTLDDPLIIAGGPVTGNMEPIADFLDAVCVGDGESAIVDILEVVHRGGYDTREALLHRLASLKGVYVPSLYTTVLRDGLVIPEGPMVCLRTESNLEDIAFVTNQIIPHCEAVQDRAVVEVARGCTRGCRFCQAGVHYRPVRERSVATILDLARRAIASTGYREFSLISLSISDYSQLGVLISSLHEQFSSHGVSFSLPSLRLDSFTIELAQRVQEIRKSGLTFAVEGGSDDIRRIINKTVTEENLFEVIGIASNMDWKSVKLYFMIGLPHTTPEEETKSIQSLLEKLAKAFPRISITASVAVFIPKPHTPFQWAGQIDPEQAMAAFQQLITVFRRHQRIRIRYNHPHLSFLEGVLSRGDRRLAPLILEVWKRGARFDSWNDRVRLDLWNECFREMGIDAWHYLRQKDESTVLPWHIIQTTSADFLHSENTKAHLREYSPDCRQYCANQCRICDFDRLRPHEAGESQPRIEADFLSNIRIDMPPKATLRFVFEKKGCARYLSPTDLEEALSRAVIRANLPACYTQGFNPHFRFAFLWALPLGFESVMEPAEVNVWQDIAPEVWIRTLNKNLPEGLRLTQARLLPLGTKSLSQQAKTHMCTLQIHAEGPLYASIDDIPAEATFVKHTKSGEKTLRVRDYLLRITREAATVTTDFLLSDGGIRVQDAVEIVAGIRLPDMLQKRPMVLSRYVVEEGENRSLFDL